MSSNYDFLYNIWWHFWLWLRCNFRSWLPVPLPVMTSYYHFRLWLPVGLPVMTSGTSFVTTSDYDLEYHFQYNFWLWLPGPLPVMTSGRTTGTSFGTTSDYDFQYHFRLWLLAPHLAMTFGATSGYYFPYHSWLWLFIGSYIPCRHGTTSEPILNQYYPFRAEPILNGSWTVAERWLNQSYW